MSKKRIVSSSRGQRPNIPLPDGEVLTPRKVFAETVSVCEKTITRLNLPTTYIGGVAYLKRNESLQIIGGRAQRRNQPRSA